MGLKDPEIEKKETVNRIMEKHGIYNSMFLKENRIYEAYIGNLPKLYIFNKNGDQVLLPNCWEVLQENLYKLIDTIPDKTSAVIQRDSFIQNYIQMDNESKHKIGNYNFQVYFYWSAWLGKGNLKKLKNAQKTIELINQKQKNQIVLIPVNFDFIKESGWTEESIEQEFRRVKEAKTIK
jgi:hypothetical protein